MGGFQDISVVKTSPPEIGVNGYTGHRPGHSEIWKKGSTLPGWKEGERTYPLECDILYERDIEIKMRDGARLYTDILRPANTDEKVPVLVMWSPYGKEYTSLLMLPVTTWKCGVRSDEISGREKFEGLDPARWCSRGYALAHVDIRGAGNSDGKVHIMSQQMREDGYDTIEALAKLPWCNGKVGMGGNSFLAIAQWHIASLNPPSLKAISPMEGSGDLYRDQFCRGGTFDLSNMGLISKLIIKSKEGSEDFDAMYNRFPYANCQYWQEKRPDMTTIDVPCYITGSDFSSIHTMGAVRGYNEIKSKHKYLVWSGYQEWHDLYSIRHHNEELMDFFDIFLKDKKNDFLKRTPKVRWTVLQHGDRDPIDNIVLDHFPPSNTEYKTFYLSENGQLAPSPLSQPQMLSYNSEVKGDAVTFTLKFDKPTRLIGVPKAYLHMSCPDYDDFIVYVQLRKLDANGKQIPHLTIRRDHAWANSIDEIKPEDRTGLILWHGSFGILRASRRAIDRNVKTWHENVPWHPHDKDEKVTPGEIVELEIGIWPIGVQYDAGESIQVHISALDPRNPELQEAPFNPRRPSSEKNHGKHQVHFGGEHESRIILPFVPYEQ